MTEAAAPLTERGEAQCLRIGNWLKTTGRTFTMAFTSPLQRATHSLDLILSVLGQMPAPSIVRTPALNERDYGDLNGKNKEECARIYGKDLVGAWRRSYGSIPPNGESLE
jgi:2,3-bisphosphoglycerate-dependent phosphoglycerate mutase